MRTANILNTPEAPGLKGQHKFYIANTLMPLAPEKLTVTIDNQNETLRLLDGRSLKVLNDPGLTSYEFELVFPGNPSSWQGWAMWDTGFKEPYKYIKLFELLKDDKNRSGRVFLFTVLRSGAYNGAEIMQKCTLEDFKILEEAEDLGDFRVSVTLERYVDIKATKYSGEEGLDGVLTLKPVTDEKPSEEEIASRVKDLAPLVVGAAQGAGSKGFILKTLYGVADNFLGDGELFTYLQKMNPGIENPNLLEEGQVIRFV